MVPSSIQPVATPKEVSSSSTQAKLRRVNTDIIQEINPFIRQEGQGIFTVVMGDFRQSWWSTGMEMVRVLINEDEGIAGGKYDPSMADAFS